MQVARPDLPPLSFGAGVTLQRLRLSVSSWICFILRPRCVVHRTLDLLCRVLLPVFSSLVVSSSLSLGSGSRSPSLRHVRSLRRRFLVGGVGRRTHPVLPSDPLVHRTPGQLPTSTFPASYFPSRRSVLFSAARPSIGQHLDLDAGFAGRHAARPAHHRRQRPQWWCLRPGHRRS
jgi:hypothetical protein